MTETRVRKGLNITQTIFLSSYLTIQTEIPSSQNWSEDFRAKGCTKHECLVVHYRLLCCQSPSPSPPVYGVSNGQAHIRLYTTVDLTSLHLNGVVHRSTLSAMMGPHLGLVSSFVQSHHSRFACTIHTLSGCLQRPRRRTRLVEGDYRGCKPLEAHQA